MQVEATRQAGEHVLRSDPRLGAASSSDKPALGNAPAGRPHARAPAGHRADDPVRASSPNWPGTSSTWPRTSTTNRRSNSPPLPTAAAAGREPRANGWARSWPARSTGSRRHSGRMPRIELASAPIEVGPPCAKALRQGAHRRHDQRHPQRRRQGRLPPLPAAPRPGRLRRRSSWAARSTIASRSSCTCSATCPTRRPTRPATRRRCWHASPNTSSGPAAGRSCCSPAIR